MTSQHVRRLSCSVVDRAAAPWLTASAANLVDWLSDHPAAVPLPAWSPLVHAVYGITSSVLEEGVDSLDVAVALQHALYADLAQSVESPLPLGLLAWDPGLLSPERASVLRARLEALRGGALPLLVESCAAPTGPARALVFEVADELLRAYASEATLVRRAVDVSWQEFEDRWAAAAAVCEAPAEGLLLVPAGVAEVMRDSGLAESLGPVFVSDAPAVFEVAAVLVAEGAPLQDVLPLARAAVRAPLPS